MKLGSKDLLLLRILTLLLFLCSAVTSTDPTIRGLYCFGATILIINIIMTMRRIKNGFK